MSRVDHGPIQFGFEHVGRRKSKARVEAFNAEEQKVGLEMLERLFGERSDKGEGIFAEDSAGEDYIDGSS
jgi:hypothetical protein